MCLGDLRFLLLVIGAAFVAPGSALSGEVADFPAPAGGAARQMVVYSSLDTDLAAPLVAAFQVAHPDIAVRYEDLLTGELHDRIVKESRAGGKTADFAFSSAMDLQVKLANDGYARPVLTPDTADWPAWANWRDTAYALTFEPAVFAYHKPSFVGRKVPDTRADLIAWLGENPAGVHARIGTYDITQSGVGYLFLARDQELYPGIWAVVEALGKADVQQFATSGDLLDRIADGRLIFGYNLLGSYVAEAARQHPEVGLVLPRDFTVVVSRVALVPTAAASPDLGAEFLSFLMSPEGQSLLSRELRLPAVSLEVAGRGGSSGGAMDIGTMKLRPVPVSPGLLAYLDQATRKRLIDRWNDALAGN
ncbi:ABC transporter substrate-binding protein [Tabrizicola sp. J26]|uniref:ABC transporter substrate-binding protein n=1 Tax=Alitabrizicola rongguiensis TaxID=2909234 RepID=UPI001F314107|nr:ABC transporter substrate-binding protein [Tabrizicola rongguiensis]MCF1709388.1 ABC transporter substrate-binding protein [Tabrizicola rongguiensis]